MSSAASIDQADCSLDGRAQAEPPSVERESNLPHHQSAKPSGRAPEAEPARAEQPGRSQTNPEWVASQEEARQGYKNWRRQKLRLRAAPFHLVGSIGR